VISIIAGAEEAQEKKSGVLKSGEAEVVEGVARILGAGEVSHPGIDPLVSLAPHGVRIDVEITIVVSLHAVTMVTATGQGPLHQQGTEEGGTSLNQQVVAGHQGGDEKAVTCGQGKLDVAAVIAPALAGLR